MTWLQALVLGLVQGLTEFIPVSSTAHLRVVPALLGWDDPGAAFTAVIQLGTLVAMLVYFAEDIRRLAWAGLQCLWRPDVRAGSDARLAWAIAAGNVPIVLLGLAFRRFIESGARSLVLIAAMLIAVALLLAWAERRARQQRVTADLGFGQVLAIGAFQALALLPGASRSGSTILGGLLLGMRRDEAARFSFLLGIPAILGAGLFQLAALLRHGPSSGWLPLAVASLAALVSGYWSIGFLLRYLTTHSTRLFVGYRLLLGAVLLLLAWQGWVR